ncbi:Na(+)/H(+) antiporter subunit B [Streptomyces sp. NPDC057686]|uniref:Na(+)/H(+) antiporter subunit B n=1 Tax=Streptomyces sp. NPDC057686 TaxID=3346212 RepID=UPI003676352E
MDDALLAVALLLVVASATLAVLCREPVRQAAALAVLGLALTLLFVVLQAPDVALSQLAVGTALTPLLILLAARKVRRPPAEQPAPEESGQHGDRRRPGGPRHTPQDRS